jgi:hypothetical protein
LGLSALEKKRSKTVGSDGLVSRAVGSTRLSSLAELPRFLGGGLLSVVRRNPLSDRSRQVQDTGLECQMRLVDDLVA